MTDGVINDQHSPSDTRMFPTDPAVIANTIGIPLEAWSGRCHAIAAAVHEHLPIEHARLARGHWIGPTADTGPFAGRPFSGHSWIALYDGRVLDPTRYAFEDREPYIYIGISDHYDEEGRLTRHIRRPPSKTGSKIDLDPVAAAILAMILPDALSGQLTAGELFWIGNQIEPSAPSAPLLYKTLDGLGFRAAVPIDNWNRVIRFGDLMAKPLAQGFFVLA